MKSICNRLSFVATGLLASLAVGGTAMGQAGAVVAWGENGSGQCVVPTTLGPCTQVSVGDSHIVALKANGAVQAWGANWHGRSNVPLDLGSCIQIAATKISSGALALAIQSNGTVKTWGESNPIPTDLGSCKAIATGGSVQMALKSDGTITAWGNNYFGQLNIPCGLSTAIANGTYHCVALDISGKVWAWGAGTNTSGNQDPNGNPNFGQSMVPSNLGVCKAIAAGDYHSAAIKMDGTVAVWGKNNQGQCAVPADLGTCTSVAAGMEFTVALQANGLVRSWGYNGNDTPSNLGPCIKISAWVLTKAAIQAPLSIITGVLPISGPSSGNTNITITGTNFFNPSTVTIGGAPATNVVVVSDTQITATTPAGFPGPAVVTVNLGSSTAFYYRPTCGSDIDNNGVVDNADLGILLLDYGSCSESAAATEPLEPVQIPMIEQTPLAAKK